MHRVLIISHTYIPPSNRGKLRALAAPGGAGGTPALAPRGAVYASERGAPPALARRLAPQPHVAPAARSDRRERGRGRAGARGRAGPPSRRDPAARRPRADRARARASRGPGDRVRRPFGPGEGNRYFVAGAGREPRASLAPDGGGRRPRPGAVGAAGVRPAARGARPLERRPAARGSAEAVARAGRAG